MDRQQYDKSAQLLEDLIVHFFLIEEFELVARLCGLILECDAGYADENNVPSPLEEADNIRFDRQTV